MDLIPFRTNYVMIEETCGTLVSKYRALLRDPIGIGLGDTKREAAFSLVKSLRKAADDIEKAIHKSELG